MNLVILYCFVCILSAFANQVPVPLQQYPAYQTSVYNVPASPVVYQTATASYSHPCAPYIIAQNQAPNQVANAIVNTVPKTPTIRSILDPNSVFYNQNGMELQKTMYSQPTVPNIINNYFIVPSDFFNLNESILSTAAALPNIPNNGMNHNMVETVELLTHMPQSTFTTNENVVKMNEHISKTEKDTKQNTQLTKEPRKKSKKRTKSKLQTTQIEDEENELITKTSHSGNQKKVNVKYEKNVSEGVTSSTRNQENVKKILQAKDEQTDYNYKLNPDLIISENNKRLKNQSKKCKKAKTVTNTASYNKENNEIPKPGHYVQESYKDISEENIPDINTNYKQKVLDISSNKLNEACFEDVESLVTCLSDSDSRVTRSSQDEEILKNFRQNFPDIPVELARKMLSFVQDQYKNQYQHQNYYQNQMNRPFYYPGLPFQFDQVFQMPFMPNYGQSNREIIPKNKSRRRKSRKLRNKKRTNANNKISPKLTDPKLFDTDTERNIDYTTVKMEDIVTGISSNTETDSLLKANVILYTPTTMLPTEAEVLVPKIVNYPNGDDYSKNVKSKEPHASEISTTMLPILTQVFIPKIEDPLGNYDYSSNDESEETYSLETPTTKLPILTQVFVPTSKENSNDYDYDTIVESKENHSLNVPTTTLPIVSQMILPKTEKYPIDDYNRNIASKEIHEDYEEIDLGYHDNKMPELGDEDTVPIIYNNGLIDDYYPSFTDITYYTNSNEYSIKDLNERYHYTTDRNTENSIRDRKKLEKFKETVPNKLKHSFRDAIPNHTYLSADRESYKNLIKEIVQPKPQSKYRTNSKKQKEIFKTPPGLENPDFRTKRINKDSMKAEDYKIDDGYDGVAAYFDHGQKASVYSNAKTLHYDSKAKFNSEASYVPERLIDSSGAEVETLFANSKVAKYGVENKYVTSPEFEGIKDFENDIYVVTAQSVGDIS